MPIIQTITPILLALGACWTNAVRTKELLQEFRGITLSLMSRILLPLLPAYIGLSLCTLAYQGYFIKYLPLLLLALIIIIPAYMVWVLEWEAQTRYPAGSGKINCLWIPEVLE